ncbi:MAG TPA: Hsp33 family molecular chaperone HslO [Thermoanaerobaculia bacterium]|nr:Hsp33 family molecular chaperone HslO [Thermoanaerobaculia bacterium]
METMDHSEPEREPFARGALEVGLAGDGDLRWAVVDLSAIVEAARGRLDLSPVAATALGRTLAGAALMMRLAIKTPSRLLVELVGDGPLGSVLAEVDDLGRLRGSVANPRAVVAHREDGKLAVGAAVGKGRLRVLRELPNGRYHSQVQLVSGEVGEDLAHYLEQSEQTRSAVMVGVLARPAGITAAGGMIVEVLPGASKVVVDTLEDNLSRLAGFSRLIEREGLDGAVSRVLAGLEPRIHSRHDLTYTCRCSRQRVERQLEALVRAGEPLTSEDGDIVVDCSFCGERYRFLPEELQPAN